MGKLLFGSWFKGPKSSKGEDESFERACVHLRTRNTKPFNPVSRTPFSPVFGIFWDITYDLHLIPFFGLPNLYIYDPIRQPQTGTTMETIDIGCSLPVVSKNGVNAGPPPWTPNHHASPYVQTRIALSAPSCFGKSINLHDVTQS